MFLSGNMVSLRMLAPGQDGVAGIGFTQLPDFFLMGKVYEATVLETLGQITERGKPNDVLLCLLQLTISEFPGHGTGRGNQESAYEMTQV